jgi:hypothetical protein
MDRANKSSQAQLTQVAEQHSTLSLRVMRRWKSAITAPSNSEPRAEAMV